MRSRPIRILGTAWSGLKASGRVFKKLTILLAVAFGTLALVAGLALGFAWWRAGADLNSIPALTDPSQAPLPSPVSIYSADGQKLGSAVVEDRIILSPKQIPQVVKDAVIAVEDQRFYEHRGVDPMALGRAAWADIRTGRADEGASTITMQLVRNVHLSFHKTLLRKVKEVALAMQLESMWTKERVLTSYLNTVYFGEGTYGIEAAARHYFGRPASRLRLHEAATLAAVIRNANELNPRNARRRVRQRRNFVLDEMFHQGYATRHEILAAKRRKLRVLPLSQDRQPTEPVLFNIAFREAQRLLTPIQRRLGGYRITTTVDLDLVRRARSVMAEQYGGVPDPPALALAHVDPRTGAVLALAQSVEKGHYSVAAQAQRQPGSTVKAFTLARYLMNGGQLADAVDNSQVASPGAGGRTWVVNPTRGAGTVAEAIRWSQNPAFVRLFQSAGPGRVLALERALGVTGMDANPAAALGGVSLGTNPLQMAGAFGTFAADGTHHRPYLIERITDDLGNVLYQHERAERPPMPVPEEVARNVNAALTSVTKDGFASLRQNLTVAKRYELAGKTGTTESEADAWFVGYTPRFVTAVWTGYPESRRSMEGIAGEGVQGATVPAQVFDGYARQALRVMSIEPEGFPKPRGLVYLPKIRRGTPTAKAVEMLNRYRVNYVLTGLPRPGRRPNTVLRLSPRGGTWIPSGKTVQVAYARSELAVPQLVGRDYLAARRLVGPFITVNETYSVVNDKPMGTIVSQEPPAGMVVDVSVPIEMRIAIRRAPPRTVEKLVPYKPTDSEMAQLEQEIEALRGEVKVPAVKGLERDAAVSVLHSLGLTTSTYGDEGQVTAQDPAPGGRIPAGGSVTIWVE